MGTKMKLLVVAFMSAMLAVGCTKKSSSSSSTASSDMTIAGALALSDSGTGALSKISSAPKGVNAFAATSVTDLEIYAIAFTVPPAIASATLDANGNFSVTLPGAKGSAVTAIFRDKTDQSQVGTVVFVDSSSKDLNGNESESSSIVLNDSVQLGAITLGSDGKVKIPVSQIQTAIGSSDSVSVAFDPTGVWYMKEFDGQVPTGYQTVGACGEQNDGPCIGFPLSLVRYTGKEFTPGSSCTSETSCPDGSGTEGSDRYALSIWGGSVDEGIGACGSKSGFTSAEARFHAHINIGTFPMVGSTQILEGPYDYTMPTGFCGDGGAACSSPFDKDWMYRGATSNHEYQDCRPTTIPGVSGGPYEGWACKSAEYTGNWGETGTPSGVKVWNVGVQGGGCINADTLKPVNATNWSSMPQGECTPTDVTAKFGQGFWSNSCVYSNFDHDGDGGTTTPAINVKCDHIGGQFADLPGSPDYASPYQWAEGKWVGAPETLLGQNKKCDFSDSGTSADTDAKKLLGYRCFAESYWLHANSGSSACMREYRFDWSATNLADFARDSDRGKPKNAFITNILKYSPDGGTATIEDEEKQKMTINTGMSSSTFCEASRRSVLTFRKITATRLLVDLKQSGQMNSTDAACIAAAKDALAGKQVGGGDLQHFLSAQNMIFYVDTTP